MLREPFLIALFILCLVVSALFAAELWTGPEPDISDGDSAKQSLGDPQHG
ncbi:hypothetical protein [Desulfovibrio sp.]|nr:hypothetical protein [Desulfovibrio sp.]